MVYLEPDESEMLGRTLDFPNDRMRDASWRFDRAAEQDGRPRANAHTARSAILTQCTGVEGDIAVIHKHWGTKPANHVKLASIEFTFA